MDMVVAPSQFLRSFPCAGSYPGFGVQVCPLTFPAAVTSTTPRWYA